MRRAGAIAEIGGQEEGEGQEAERLPGEEAEGAIPGSGPDFNEIAEAEEKESHRRDEAAAFGVGGFFHCGEEEAGE